MNKDLLHLYVAFWRPDVLAGMQGTFGKGAAICDYVGPTANLTCETPKVTCPACQFTFLESMPTGSGKKMTWLAFCAMAASNPPKSLRDRAAEMDAASTGWSTKPSPAPIPAPAGGWSTKPTAASVGSSGGWRTK